MDSLNESISLVINGGNMASFRFKKYYGQNFLKNRDIISKIVNSIDPTEKDLIIEIGPGAGALTKELKKYKTQLLAFEIDTDTKDYLEPLMDEKTSVLFEDFLKVNLNEIFKNYKYEKLYFIGNLPYYITTPIIEHILKQSIEFESLTIMVQREVALRFMARPHTKNYGYMTVILNYWFEIQKIIDVGRNNFYPVPNVDSVVLKLNRVNRENIDYEKFQKVVKDSFQFKRKTLNNNLKKYNKELVEKVLNEHGSSLQNRAEDIDLNTYIDLARI